MMQRIDFKKPEIIDALDDMGYAKEDMPLWEHEAIMLHRGTLDGEPDYPYAKTPIAQLFARNRWSVIGDVVEKKED